MTVGHAGFLYKLPQILFKADFFAAQLALYKMQNLYQESWWSLEAAFESNSTS